MDPGWRAVLAGLVVSTLLASGAAVGYYFLFFETRFTCDRARDSCEVVESNRLRRELTHRFPPSRVADVRYEQGRRRSCVVVEMSGGGSPAWICGTADERYVAALEEFLAEPGRERLDYRVKPSMTWFALMGLFACFVLFPALRKAFVWVRGEAGPAR